MTNLIFKCIITAHLVLVCSSSFSQNITFNSDIDTLLFPSVAPVYKVWNDFLTCGSDSVGSQYWNRREVQLYGDDSYWFIENKLFFPSNDLLKSWFDTKVGYVHTLTIKDLGSNLFKISAYKALSFPNDKRWDYDSTIMNPDEINREVFYFFHLYCKKEELGYKLYNALPINSELFLNHTKVDYLNYHYPKIHSFDMQKAAKQNDFIIELCKNFEIELREVDYYFTETVEDLDRLRGFDFVVGQTGKNIPSGQADSKNDVVYCTGTDEYYPHELVHVFLNKDYSNCHGWMNEGIATFLGGSRGESLQWHAKRTSEYLSEHPEIDLDSCLNYNNMDEYTDYRYVLGGVLMKSIHAKGGMI